MMDEYIPSPRQTPNKPRRMRDASVFYPVDEKKLLLEALLKRQRDDSAGEVSVGRPRASEGPAGDSSPTRARISWREDRACPVCRCTTSNSPGTSGSEYDGDESDGDTSACGDQPAAPESDSVSSDSVDEEDDRPQDGEEGSEATVGIGDGAGGNEAEHGEPAEIAEETYVEREAQKCSSQVHAPDVREAPPSLQPLQVSEPGDRPTTREGFSSPGKLLYGRHCLWYQSAGFVRPQGGK